MASTLPTFTSQAPAEYDVDADAALVQKGVYKKPSFYGDQTVSQSHVSFMSGVNTALSWAGQAAMKFETIKERNENTGYKLTEAEFKLLQRRASSIANYSKIPYDTCEDFLVILCFVNDIIDMRKIADAVQIPELDNPAILRQPMQILNIPKLEKICFAAQALDGLVNMFRKYTTLAQNTPNKSKDASDVSSILNTMSSLMGGFGGGAASLGPRLELGEMGNYLSELISGKRVPTNVIAKNPMLQAPSYVGKAFFGEHPNALANFDIDQLFNKAIAVFPQMQSGAGTSAFSMQNFSSFQQAMPLTNFVSKVVTGSPSMDSQRKINQVMGVVNQITSLTGAKPTDTVEINRADNAIPIMMGIATSLSGMDKPIFSAATFQQGWATAQSVGNQLMNIDPSFMEAARRFL